MTTDPLDFVADTWRYWLAASAVELVVVVCLFVWRRRRVVG